MKKSRMYVPAACALLLLAAPLAAQMDNLTNLSVEWMRMPARNAAVDSADIVVYNPAALVRLDAGFHLNVGNQSLIRKPRHTYSLDYGLGERSFAQKGIDAFLPNLYAAYKKNNWSIYGGLYISGGGAVADYPDGSFATDLVALGVLASPVLDETGQPTGYTYGDLYGGTMGQTLKASSYYLTGILGGAYAVNDKLSASAGLRYVRAVNTTKLGLTLAGSPLALPDQPLLFDTEDKAGGLGFVLGVNYDLNEKLNVSAHYESQVKLDFETRVNRDDFGLAVDGEKLRRDLPAVLYLGAGYRWSEKLLMLVDVNYWFQKAADWGPTGLEQYRNWSDAAGDCWAAGIGLEYALSGRLRLSAGTVFTDFLFKDKEAYYLRFGEFEAPKGDNLNCGVGLAYRAAEGLTLNLALGGTFWAKETIAWSGSLPVEIKAHAYSLSVGANLDL